MNEHPPSDDVQTTRNAARSPWRVLLMSLGGLAFLPVFALLFSSAPACMGFEGPTLRTLQACPEVAAALGTPIHRSWWGMSCGNAETEGAFGNASWTFPVEGPIGRGSVSVVSEMRGGPWMLYSAVVETDRGNFEAVSCAQRVGSGGLPGPSGAAPAGLFAFGPLRRTMHVTTASPAAPVAVGTECTVDIGPGAGPFPCRVQVACGGAVLYGGGTTGFVSCTEDGAGGLAAFDTSGSDDGGDPMLTLSTSSGVAVLSDDASSGSWTLTLALGPP